MSTGRKVWRLQKSLGQAGSENSGLTQSTNCRVNGGKMMIPMIAADSPGVDTLCSDPSSHNFGAPKSWKSPQPMSLAGKSPTNGLGGPAMAVTKGEYPYYVPKLIWDLDLSDGGNSTRGQFWETSSDKPQLPRSN